MFEAYSKKLNKPINVTEVTDLSDTFMCLNSNCTAEYTIRAINSNKLSMYFGRKPSTPHIIGCPFSIDSKSYVDNANMIKSDIEEIYDHTYKNSAGEKTQNMHNGDLRSNNLINKKITTPKQLFYYCISNKLTTEYKNGIKVGDIILDSRNLCSNANFQGITGLHIVMGSTYKFDKIAKTITVRISTKTTNNKKIYLTATILLSKEQINEIVKYILDTYNGKFANHSIAIFGYWKNDSKYHISCTVNKKSYVIYKF